MEQGTEIASVPTTERDEQVLCAAFSPDGTKIALGGGFSGKIDERTFGTVGRLRLWDVGSGKLINNLELPEKDGSIRGVVFSADGNVLAAGRVDRQLRL